MKLARLAAAASLLLAGCNPASSPHAAGPDAPRATPLSTQSVSTQPIRRTPATPIAIPGVANFAQISPILYRGEQPTAAGFAELKRRGIRTVVSLRTLHGDGDALKGTGLASFRIFAKPWHPEEEDLLTFLKILSDPDNQPVFVHCQFGSDRTGYMVAGYRIVDQGWTYTDAAAEMKAFHFHTVWTEVPEALQSLDPAAIREKVARLPPPKVAAPE